jgi:hypothetical protein
MKNCLMGACAASLSIGYSAIAYAGTPFEVPSDPKGRYAALSIREIKWPVVEIVTQRIGPSGTSYARREVNCAALTFRYTGDADDLETLKTQNIDDPFGELVKGSISDVVSRYACRNVK